MVVAAIPRKLINFLITIYSRIRNRNSSHRNRICTHSGALNQSSSFSCTAAIRSILNHGHSISRVEFAFYLPCSSRSLLPTNTPYAFRDECVEACANIDVLIFGLLVLHSVVWIAVASSIERKTQHSGTLPTNSSVCIHIYALRMHLNTHSTQIRVDASIKGLKF